MTQNIIIPCHQEKHANAILEIFNEAIINSTAIYEYQPRTLENINLWFQTKKNSKLPIIGIENDQGQLLAFGSYGTFRAWPAYKYTVEHSVYVHKDHRGQGLGYQVMQALISTAQQNNVHTIIGGIDTMNINSIALHKRLGFQHIGTLSQVGFKFGRWLDLAFYQLLLNTPLNPLDG